ncbi:hypothetical protein Goklo_027954 [Gossypium klotzschianum]|uniref:Uncharacterized protein n=1 Tax=Gossypium klotzschianum TaxID=34286 RepID=A0A7J8TZZ7_9ROSI|nr:hypothetical protein [Gossypium klotzschianum]
MRGGKDKMSPMFPRLHVNVTNKGPKAPPRNKISLYEQLNVPSQRFNLGSLSMLRLPPNNNNNSLRFSSRKLRLNDYLMVSTTAVFGIDQNCSCSQQSKGWGSFSKLNLRSLMQLYILDEKKMKGSDSVDLDFRRYAVNEFDGSGRLFQSCQNLIVEVWLPCNTCNIKLHDKLPEPYM